MKRRKNVTIAEIIIAVVIIGILATISIPIFNNVIENSKAKTCELNLDAILGAVEAQTIESNAFPASLSSLTDKNLEKGWAKVLQKEGSLKVKLIYFLANLDKGNLAYAQPQARWLGKFISSNSVLICPASAHGQNSYGINSSLRGMSYSQYKALSSDTAIVGDCAASSFSGEDSLEPRHKKYHLFSYERYAQMELKNKQKKKIKHNY
ncbi:MAG: hypothetical protein WC546_06350 [Candidatus Omnitrophota bacterium]